MAGLDLGAVATITVAILLSQVILSIYYALRARVAVARKRQPQAEAG